MGDQRDVQRRHLVRHHPRNRPRNMQADCPRVQGQELRRRGVRRSEPSGLRTRPRDGGDAGGVREPDVPRRGVCGRVRPRADEVRGQRRAELRPRRDLAGRHDLCRADPAVRFGRVRGGATQLCRQTGDVRPNGRREPLRDRRNPRRDLQPEQRPRLPRDGGGLPSGPVRDHGGPIPDICERVPHEQARAQRREPSARRIATTTSAPGARGPRDTKGRAGSPRHTRPALGASLVPRPSWPGSGHAVASSWGGT